MVDERNRGEALQVRLPDLIEHVFCDVTATHGGAGARMKLAEWAYVYPDIVLVVDDERSENVDVSSERYGEWDVVEHAEPRRQGRDGPLRNEPRT